ncbi:MAG: hypothetical protein M1827_006248 [Pycnora praestabilis]|nr:MAG: hypothetical protein M1827_006248 [Pycnora praestabilis]
MAALHSALKSLSPTEYTSIPHDDLKSYLRETFLKSQLLVDSIPPPPISEAAASLPTSRPRSDTGTSSASSASEISLSSARAKLAPPEFEALQKEWGKPIKLSAKENPLGMTVYKCSGKDGKGAWFARRSVHEGLGFTKWKKGLEREFPETLLVQGAPGEGNIRGIGGEKRIEKTVVPGVGKLEVYHLSAQFPGPTTPRDFVTLLHTSSTALSTSYSTDLTAALDSGQNPSFKSQPRHYMVVSKPCIHPECPPRDGFIRGQYESVEMIREIPLRRPKASSTTDLHWKEEPRTSSSDRGRDTVVQNARQSNGLSPTLDNEDNEHRRSSSAGRVRGKTISFAESRGRSAKGEQMDNPTEEDEAETNPVEWIMITRSDPGGSVPRFLVERGTPGSIVADASKFLDWACKKEHPPEEEDDDKTLHDEDLHDEEELNELSQYQTNGHLAGLEEKNPMRDIPEEPKSIEPAQEEGIFSGVTGAVSAGISNYAPTIVADKLVAHQQEPPPSHGASVRREIINGTSTHTRDDTSSILSDTTSIASFVSAEEGEAETEGDTKSTSSQSTSSQTKDSTTTSNPSSPNTKELAKLQSRKQALDDKLAKTKEKTQKDKDELGAKEISAFKKAEEKHAKEVAKQEEKYKKEIAKIEARKEKEMKKAEEKRRKVEEKDEKLRLTRERDDFKAQLDVLTKEKDLLRNQVGDLQRENTALAARLGKAPDGKDLLREVREEVNGKKGARSRGTSSTSGRLPAEQPKDGSLRASGSKESLTSTLKEKTIDGVK